MTFFTDLAGIIHWHLIYTKNHEKKKLIIFKNKPGIGLHYTRFSSSGKKSGPIWSLGMGKTQIKY